MKYDLDLPAGAKEKIIRTYGVDGEGFLSTLSKKLEKYLSIWEIYECKFFNHSLNLIYECKSQKYGDVIIKARVPEDGRLFTEISALKFYNDKGHTCKIYEYSIEDGLLLLEKITPGYTLKDTISDPIAKADVFIDIYRDYHLPCDDTAVFPTIISSMEMFEKNLDTDINFVKYKNIARVIYHEINNKYSKKCLLHGDLNFRNILLHDKTYKAIDPVGIIGDPIFDIPRYLLNELTDAIHGNREFNKAVVLHVSKSLELPVSLLYGLLLFDTIITISYHLGNPIPNEKYAFHIKRCETAYELYSLERQRK